MSAPLNPFSDVYKTSVWLTEGSPHPGPSTDLILTVPCATIAFASGANFGWEQSDIFAMLVCTPDFTTLAAPFALSGEGLG